MTPLAHAIPSEDAPVTHILYIYTQKTYCICSESALILYNRGGRQDMFTKQLVESVGGQARVMM